MSRACPTSEWFSAAEIAALKLPGLPTSKRGVQFQAERECWAQVLGPNGESRARTRRSAGGGVEYHLGVLPECARVALAGGRSAPTPAERPDRESAWAQLDRLPRSMRDEAVLRMTVLDRVDELERAGLSRSRAIDEVVDRATREAKLQGEKPPFSVGTVYAWGRLVVGVARPDRLAYLAPRYTGRTAKAPCPAEAWELFKADYLRPERPTYAASYRRLERVSAERGWTIPSQKTLERRIAAEIPASVQTLMREGKEALDHSFPHMTRDRAPLSPMQIINLDGHTWDVRVKWEDGTVGRPIALAVQDISSSKALGLRFDKTLNHHLVRLALGDVFREHGLAETVYMDNGRENAAKAISGGQSTRWRWKVQDDEPAGILKMLGIKAVFATPYWGQAKPIERMFRDWADEIAKHPAFAGAYTGNKPTAKPENYGSHAVPIAEFERVVRAELKHYNAQRGRAGVHLAGRSFDQAFADGLAVRQPRRATPEQLRLCLLATQAVSMNARDHAVSIDGHRYWSPELGDRKRSRVSVRFDPESLASAVHVYTLDGVYICAAPRVAEGDFETSAKGQQQRRDVRDWRRKTQAARAAAVRLGIEDVAAALNHGESESSESDAQISDRRGAVETNIVRPAFGAPRAPEQAGAPPSPSFEDSWERGVAALPRSG